MIKICTPYYMSVSDATNNSVAKLQAAGVDCFWETVETTYIGRGQNCAICGCDNVKTRPNLDQKFTHYLTLDSDIAFEPEDVKRLLALDKDVVSGIYRSREDDSKYVGGWWGSVPGMDAARLESGAAGLLHVDWVGAGFMLVKKHVFEEMPYPWFTHMVSVHKEYSFELGEDQGFCSAAALLGFKIYADADTEVTHLTNKKEAYNMPSLQDLAPKQEGPILEQILLSIHRNSSAILRDVAQLEDTIRGMAHRIAEQEKVISELTPKNEKDK